MIKKGLILPILSWKQVQYIYPDKTLFYKSVQSFKKTLIVDQGSRIRKAILKNYYL